MAIPKKHNLSFSDEELGIEPEKLKVDVHKASKNVNSKKSMKTKDNLKFEENKVKPSEKYSSRQLDKLKGITLTASSNRFHRRVEDENDDDNVSVDAVNKGTEYSENAVHRVKTHVQRQNRKAKDTSSVKTRQNRKSASEERPTNVDELFNEQEKYKTEDTQYKASAYSKWKQRQNIKKQYYSSKSEGAAVAPNSVTEGIKERVKTTVKNEKKNVDNFVSKNKGLMVVMGGVLALIVGISVLGSSGGIIAQSGTGAVALTTYPSDDTEMIEAENYYCHLESTLQKAVSSYESTHSYDEYHYSLDEISHDPYELTSLLTAKSEGPYTATDIKSFETSVYNKQYQLSQKVVTETRYRTEYRYRTVVVNNPDGTTSSYVERYSVRVYYPYYICYVTLKNNGMEYAADKLLNTDQKDMYEVYNETKGNREDLFEN